VKPQQRLSTEHKSKNCAPVVKKSTPAVKRNLHGQVG